LKPASLLGVPQRKPAAGSRRKPFPGQGKKEDQEQDPPRVELAGAMISVALDGNVAAEAGNSQVGDDERQAPVEGSPSQGEDDRRNLEEAHEVAVEHR